MEAIQSGMFGLPLDTEEAKMHINGRKKTLVKVFTEGFSALIYLMDCGIETYGVSTPLCLIPYENGAFEIAPVYKAGLHLPTCLPGINFLWSKVRSSKTDFIKQATAIANTWLVAHGAYVTSRLEPSTCLPIWTDIILGESVSVAVESYYKEEQAKLKEEEILRAVKLSCAICETVKSELGVCCNKCKLWRHLSCAATSAAEELDQGVNTSDERYLTNPDSYVCQSCED